MKSNFLHSWFPSLRRPALVSIDSRAMRPASLPNTDVLSRMPPAATVDRLHQFWQFTLYLLLLLLPGGGLLIALRWLYLRLHT